MADVVRIANCSGFYGDRLGAAREMVEGGPIDVLTGDWLAELTMMILALDQLKKPELGYARTFVKQVQQVLPMAMERGIRIVSNAGGLNPRALARAVREIAERTGTNPRIAVVTGDDLRAQLPELASAGLLSHAFTGEPFGSGQPITANAYLGCRAIATALERGADIVITGRVTDAAVVMGPAAWFHGWGPDAHDALAGALAAGHVIECGCQATGGNYSFFEEIPEAPPGFPLAEIAADGSAVITKHPGTGGRVTRETVLAQLLYEIGPPAYVSPDAVAHFDTLQVTELGEDRVRLSGVRGSPPPSTLKLGVTLLTGHRNEMTAVVPGPDAAAKCARLERQAWAALGGRDRFEHARADRLLAHPEGTVGSNISLLTFAVRDPDPGKVGTRFTAPLVALALASVPGLTFTTAPHKPRPVGVFWPVLLDRTHTTPTVELDGETLEIPHPPDGPLRDDLPVPSPPGGTVAGEPIPLGERCGARSGDKGGDANVGLWVRDPAHYPWLVAGLTEERVSEILAPSGFTGRVTRHLLPNLGAVNFVLEGFLDRGVAHNLAPDPQAKTLGEFFRTVFIPGDYVEPQPQERP